MTIEDIGLYISYVAFFIAAGAAIVFPLLNAIKNPASLGKSLIGIIGVVVLFIVAYLVSGDEVTSKYAALGVDASGSKIIGAGLTLFYFVLVLSIIGVVYSEINKALK